MQYWLVKSEPKKYSWSQCMQDGTTAWDGVRNFQARNNLRAMKVGDLAMFYHSNDGKEVVGIVEIIRESYQDPTSESPQWLAVDVRPHTTLDKPVSLESIRSDVRLEKIGLLRQSQLSVMPLSVEEFEAILELSSRE